MERSLSWCCVAFFLAVFLQNPSPLLAADSPPRDAQQKSLSKEELAQLVAPVALYPDDLLAQVLMASTYPLEIVQADRWARQHQGLKGDQLATALEKEKWDPSVKSLVAFPTVLSQLSDKVEVTAKLGDAFLSNQKDVMDMVQQLRKKAQAAGNLKSTKEQKVTVEKETIVITPAQTQVVYVPTYSPTVVYGVWPYPAYPPYYYYPPPPSPGVYFAAGVAVGVAWGYAWGSCNWHGGTVNVNVYQNNSINTHIDRTSYQNQRPGGHGEGTWQHDPSHRQGVAYQDKGTAQRYGQSAERSAQGRREARGYGGERGSGSAATRPTGAKSSGGKGGSLFGGGYGSGASERQASERGRASRESALAGGSRAGGGLGARGGRRR